MCNLTVITVVKNGDQNILPTVNSVLKQKNCEFEYIVFEGKSSDNTTASQAQPAAVTSSPAQNEDFSGPDDSDDLPF